MNPRISEKASGLGSGLLELLPTGRTGSPTNRSVWLVGTKECPIRPGEAAQWIYRNYGAGETEKLLATIGNAQRSAREAIDGKPNHEREIVERLRASVARIWFEEVDSIIANRGVAFETFLLDWLSRGTGSPAIPDDPGWDSCIVRNTHRKATVDLDTRRKIDLCSRVLLRNKSDRISSLNFGIQLTTRRSPANDPRTAWPDIGPHREKRPAGAHASISDRGLPQKQETVRRLAAEICGKGRPEPSSPESYRPDTQAFLFVNATISETLHRNLADSQAADSKISEAARAGSPVRQEWLDAKRSVFQKAFDAWVASGRLAHGPCAYLPEDIQADLSTLGGYVNFSLSFFSAKLRAWGACKSPETQTKVFRLPDGSLARRYCIPSLDRTFEDSEGNLVVCKYREAESEFQAVVAKPDGHLLMDMTIHMNEHLAIIAGKESPKRENWDPQSEKAPTKANPTKRRGKKK